MDINSILREFGASIGLPNLCLNEQRLCRLVFDQKCTVDIELTPDEKTLYFCSVLGTMPPDGRDKLMRRLLEANQPEGLAGSARIAIDGALDEVLLVRFLVAGIHDVASFSETLEEFINACVHWSGVIKSYRPEKGEEIVLDIRDHALIWA